MKSVTANRLIELGGPGSGPHPGEGGKEPEDLVKKFGLEPTSSHFSKTMPPGSVQPGIRGASTLVKTLQQKIERQGARPEKRLVNHSEITPTQQVVSRKTIDYLKTPEGLADNPTHTSQSKKWGGVSAAVVEHEGVKYAFDGHHRMIAENERGEPNHLVDYYKVK